MRGKLIVIEGNDCSGKETQGKLLIEKLESAGFKTFTMSFPAYGSPTGDIVGGPLLGKGYICNSFFDDAATVDPLVAGLYYSADRRAHTPEIKKNLEEGKIVILDRYTFSNMGHQGGKMKSSEERRKIFDFYERLEFDMLGLARPDGVILLHMPFDNVIDILSKRDEHSDNAEANHEYLKNAESTYLEMKDLFGFKYVPCSKDGELRSVEEISEDVFKLAKEIIDGK